MSRSNKKKNAAPYDLDKRPSRSSKRTDDHETPSTSGIQNSVDHSIQDAVTLNIRRLRNDGQSRSVSPQKRSRSKSKQPTGRKGTSNSRMTDANQGGPSTSRIQDDELNAEMNTSQQFDMMSPPVERQQVQQPTMEQFMDMQKTLFELKQMIVSNNNPTVENNVNTGLNPVLNASNEPLVDDALQQHVLDIVGDNSNSQSSGFQGTYTEVGRPIDLKVTDKIRNQIWSNEFVDLSVLLDHKAEAVETLKVVESDGDLLRLARQKGKTKINGIDMWCDAFLVYLTVYTRKYPEEIASLTTYMHHIKQLSLKGGDYLYYDEEFRFLRQRGRLTWEINHDLWIECRDTRSSNFNKPNKNKFNQQSFRSFPPPVGGSFKATHPAGFCFRFHTFGKCTNTRCAFKHLCYIANCGNRHPVYLCQKGQPKGEKRNNTSSSSPGGGNTNKVN